MKRNYYHILGVCRTETSRGIRAAFRELALRYHPDRAGAHGTPFFQEINEAYDVLSDPHSRASYDRGLDHAEEHPPPAPGPISPSPRSAGAVAEPLIPEPLVPRPMSSVNDFMATHTAVDELFLKIYRNFSHHQPPRSRKLEPLDIQVHLSPAEAFRGGLIQLAVPVLFPCPSCQGSGRHWSAPCPICRQRGLIEEKQQIQLVIPAGVQHGTMFQRPLKGLGVHNLYLQVLIQIAA